MSQHNTSSQRQILIYQNHTQQKISEDQLSDHDAIKQNVLIPNLLTHHTVILLF